MNINTIRNLSMSAALVLITAYFTIRDPAYISPQNLSNLSIDLAVTATLALGMLLVLLPGMIDLSVGSGVGMLGGIAAVLITRPSYVLGNSSTGLSAPLALLIALLIALVVWGLMGALIIRQKVPAFIITLGGLLIFNGIHLLVIRNSTVPVAPGGSENIFSLLTTYYLSPKAGYTILLGVSIFIASSFFRARRARIAHGFGVDDAETSTLKLLVGLQALLLLTITMNMHRGIPLALIILGVVVYTINTLTRNTPFGRYLYAIGGNEEAARLSGVPITRIVITAYVLLGAIVAITGFLQTAYGGYSTTTVGELMELDAIAACVIGGTSLKGGRGSVLGVLFGAIIMATLLNGMTLLSVNPEMKLIARGFVLILAVWMDVTLSRKAAA